MKFLRSPLFAISLGVLLGVAAGIGSLWYGGQALIVELRAARAQQIERARPTKPWDFWTLEIDNLANELRAERTALSQRAEALNAREARLNAEAAELAQLRQQLESLREVISTRVVEIQAAEEKNLKNLALTYSNLTPRSALTILNELDEATAVKILALMKPDVTATLFEEMGRAALTDPAIARRAANLSDRLRLLRPADKTAATP